LEDVSSPGGGTGDRGKESSGEPRAGGRTGLKAGEQGFQTVRATRGRTLPQKYDGASANGKGKTNRNHNLKEFPAESAFRIKGQKTFYGRDEKKK